MRSIPKRNLPLLFAWRTLPLSEPETEPELRARCHRVRAICFPSYIPLESPFSTKPRRCQHLPEMNIGELASMATAWTDCDQVQLFVSRVFRSGMFAGRSRCVLRSL